MWFNTSIEIKDLVEPFSMCGENDRGISQIANMDFVGWGSKG